MPLLNVAPGDVIGNCHRKHRAIEFKKFLPIIDKAVPEKLEVHLVLDNYGTHETAMIHSWLARRPRFHLHFTPTSASWINQVKRHAPADPSRHLHFGPGESDQEYLVPVTKVGISILPGRRLAVLWTSERDLMVFGTIFGQKASCASLYRATFLRANSDRGGRDRPRHSRASRPLREPAHPCGPRRRATAAARVNPVHAPARWRCSRTAITACGTGQQPQRRAPHHGPVGLLLRQFSHSAMSAWSRPPCFEPTGGDGGPAARVRVRRAAAFVCRRNECPLPDGHEPAVGRARS